MLYKNPEDKKAYFKAWREANRENINAYKRAWCRANKEKYIKILEENRAYYEANKETLLEKAKAYREANKERDAERKKAWKVDNKDKVNAITAKRRAARLERTPKWLTKEDFDKIREFYTEARKKTEETGEKWHVDHIIPLQGELVSGLHIPENLQVIKATENARKNNSYTL